MNNQICKMTYFNLYSYTVGAAFAIYSQISQKTVVDSNIVSPPKKGSSFL